MQIDIKKFITFQSIIKSKADYFVFKRTLNKELHYLEEEEAIKLHAKFSKYYTENDNRWIIAYTNYLNVLSDYYLKINSKDYETASYIIETIIKLSDFILNSGVVISQRNKEKINYISNNKLRKHKSTLRAIQLIYDGKAIEYIKSFLDKVPDAHASFDELYFITLIIRQVDYNEIDELLIDLIIKLGKKGHFKIKNFISDFFDKLIHSRIRYFEDKLFLEVFSNNEVKSNFYSDKSSDILMAKKYFSCHLNLLKDDQKELTFIFKSYIKSLKFIHYEKGLEAGVKSIKALHNLEYFVVKIYSAINWDSNIDDYLSSYDLKISEFSSDNIGKSFEFEIVETIHEFSIHKLSCKEFKEFDFYLPFHRVRKRLNPGYKVKAKIYTIDNYTNSIFLNKPILFDEDSKKIDLRIGNVYDAIITNIRDFGVFILVENHEGFIPIKNISYVRIDIENLNKLFSKYDKIKVKLTSINKKKQHVFSIRDTYKLKKYKAEDFSMGTVISFGKKHANLELEDGSPAILPSYELKFEKEFSIDYFYSIGEKVKCKIKTIEGNKILVKPARQNLEKGEFTGKFLYKINDYHFFKLKDKNSTISSKFNVDFSFNKSSEILFTILKNTDSNKFEIDEINVLGYINNALLKYDLSIEKGYVYENLSFHLDSLQEKINFLAISRHFYSVGHSARAYYIRIFSDYIKLILKVKSTNETNESIKELKVYSSEILKEIENEGLSLMKFPIIRQFVNTLKSISQLNQGYLESSYFFNDNNFFDSHVRTENLSKLILGYNLLGDNIKLRNDFWKIIKESISVALLKLNFDANELSESYELTRIIERALNSNENKKLEFKASIFTPVLGKGQKLAISKLDLNNSEDRIKYDSINNSLKKPELIKDIQNTFLKTVVAFANTNGGILIVGIDEDTLGNPIELGVENDLRKFKNNLDEYMQAIDQLINNKISKEFGNHYWLKDAQYKGKSYLIVEVVKSGSPIFSKIKSDSDFFIRENTQTISLSKEETVKYVIEWFK